MSAISIVDKIDWLVLLPIFIINFFSLLIIYSLRQDLFFSQLMFVILGLICYFVLSFLDYKIFENFGLWFLILSIILLFITFFIGEVTRGAIRWIKIGSFGFQSSEFVKPLLILTFSGFASKLNLTKIKDLLIMLLIFIIPWLLIFKQPDLGNSIVLLVIWLGIVYKARIKNLYTIVTSVFVIILFPLLWNFLKPYQQQRITTFIDPNSDPLGRGYNILQALISVGAGQLFGQGLGKGSQGQLFFLPESHTDFVFSAFSEELGFIFTAILIASYFILLLRIIFIAKEHQDKFASLVAIGVFCMIFIQTVINIGMNLGIAPITGITLPLFSFGGSSILSTFICLGLLQSINNYQSRKKAIEIS